MMWRPWTMPARPGVHAGRDNFTQEQERSAKGLSTACADHGGYEHANVIAFLLLTMSCLASVGRSTRSPAAQPVQLCHFMRGDVRHYGSATYAGIILQQGHSQE